MTYIRHSAPRCVACKQAEGHAPDCWVAQYTIWSIA